MSSFFELRNICFTYPGRPVLLDNIDFALKDGERLCIAGHNGAGKSTLLKLMVGLLKPTSGQVVAFGTPRIGEEDFYEVRCRAGLVFQDPDDQLFCPTVAEDVAFGPLNLGRTQDEVSSIVDRTLQSLEIYHLRDRVTHKLSGGEKRMVTLATVLAMEPDVLLLDEPTNALDEENWERLIDVLVRLPQAMVIVSHDAHFRRRVETRTLRLKDGKLTQPDGKCRHSDHKLREV